MSRYSRSGRHLLRRDWRGILSKLRTKKVKPLGKGEGSVVEAEVIVGGEVELEQGSRRLVVIGDLHGDYFRLVRILEETGLLEGSNTSNPYELSWNENVEPTDIVLLGDYIDWRGEPLEGPPEEWKYGSSRILLLLKNLKSRPATRVRLFTLMGNHEDMMLRSLRAYMVLKEELGEEGLSEFLEEALGNTYRAIYSLSRMGLSETSINLFMEFLNWYLQGGQKTIDSFGGFEEWIYYFTAGELAHMLDDLILLLKMGSRLFVHTLPDDLELLRKALTQGLKVLKPSERERLREQLLWSRGIWGIDAFRNTRYEPPSQDYLKEVLRDIGVEVVILGHTPLRRGFLRDNRKPIVVFDGMIVNTDLHGIPYSDPYISDIQGSGEVIVYVNRDFEG